MGASRIRIEMSSDRLSARIEVRAGPAMSAAVLRDVLRDHNVVHGLDTELLQRLEEGLTKTSFTASECIARSENASSDGALELRFDADLRPWTKTEQGSYDYRDRHLLRTVARGDVVAIYRPAREVATKRVDGTMLQKPAGREFMPRLGQGVVRESSGEIIAQRDGVIAYRSQEFLDVVEHYEHEGDVNLRSGHLEMQGSVSIHGDVLRGFAVAATGDVEIDGCVRGGIDAGGDVQIDGGVLGGQPLGLGEAPPAVIRTSYGRVIAGGDIEVRHCQSGRLVCPGEISVVKDALSSQLWAGDIHIGGRLVGGVARAECSVVVREAGSPSGTETLLSVGTPRKSAREGALSVIAASRARRGRKSQLRTRERAKGGKTRRAEQNLSSEALRQRLEQQQEDRKLLKAAHIDVLATAHNGVMLRFGEHKRRISKQISRTRFRWDPESHEIVMEQLPK